MKSSRPDGGADHGRNPKPALVGSFTPSCQNVTILAYQDLSLDCNISPLARISWDEEAPVVRHTR